MKRFFNGLIALIIAVGLVIGTFYLLDITKEKPQETEEKPVDVTSSLTGRIYALKTSTDTLEKTASAYADDVDLYIAESLKEKGGGTFTGSNGRSIYVSSSGAYGTSGGSGSGSHGSSSQSGWVQTDAGWDFVGDIDINDGGNYCSSCGTYYYGNGLCPNGCQDGGNVIDW